MFEVHEEKVLEDYENKEKFFFCLVGKKKVLQKSLQRMNDLLKIMWINV